MPRIYGHRGAAGERPENSIAGLRHAKAAGADGIETDIAMTADLVPILHHNPELLNGRLIRDLTQADLIDIPTLAEALAAVPEIDWLLEIKTFPPLPHSSHPPRQIVAGIMAALATAAIPTARVMVLAFDWSVLREVETQASTLLRRVCLTASEQEKARALWWGAGFEGLSTPAAVARAGAQIWAPHHTGLTAAAIAEAHNLGLQVIAWTVNDPDEFDHLAPLVDGLITDFPSRWRRSVKPPWPRHTPKNSPVRPPVR